jgi:hypothetical protein
MKGISKQMAQEWEYLVEQFGTAFTAAKPEEVEALLNEAAIEGWEPAQSVSMSNGSKLMVILRRRLKARTRRRRSTWP